MYFLVSNSNNVCYFDLGTVPLEALRNDIFACALKDPFYGLY
jgi:hypothetical protein